MNGETRYAIRDEVYAPRPATYRGQEFRGGEFRYAVYSVDDGRTVFRAVSWDEADKLLRRLSTFAGGER